MLWCLCLYDKFILTADVIDRLSRCDVVVSQAQVNDVADVVNTPANVNDGSGTHDDVNDDVAVLSSLVAEDDVTVMAEQNDAKCDNVDEDCSNVTDGGSVPISGCSLSSSSAVAQEQRDNWLLESS